jgi:MerR family transcriptional regulator, light-induced transcriptional regulator
MVTNVDSEPTLTMREMAALSGVSDATLRMWETRYRFPAPTRLPSGHRRYSRGDLRDVLAVVHARDQGLSLASAIERARRESQAPAQSVFATLREAFPNLPADVLPKRAILALSHAIEDESIARGERPLLVGCFQEERFYRQAEPRWRELARTAEYALVLARFPASRGPHRGPAEIAIGDDTAIAREWVVVSDAPRFGACLVGLERPKLPRQPRRFETLWTVEARVVKAAAQAVLALASIAAPHLVAGLAERVAEPLSPARDELRDSIALSSRMVRYAIGG